MTNRAAPHVSHKLALRDLRHKLSVSKPLLALTDVALQRSSWQLRGVLQPRCQ